MLQFTDWLSQNDQITLARSYCLLHFPPLTSFTFQTIVKPYKTVLFCPCWTRPLRPLFRIRCFIFITQTTHKSTTLNKQLAIILQYQNSITALGLSCFAFSLTAGPANGPLVYQACKTSLIHKKTYIPQTSHPHSDRYIPHTAFCVMLQMWSPLTR